jgi:hypothetical protein
MKITNLFLNSSGTSTDGCPRPRPSAAFDDDDDDDDLATRSGFSSCAVRDGRETYGRVSLHSYVKCPVVVVVVVKKSTLINDQTNPVGTYEPVRRHF